MKLSRRNVVVTGGLGLVAAMVVAVVAMASPDTPVGLLSFYSQHDPAVPQAKSVDPLLVSTFSVFRRVQSADDIPPRAALQPDFLQQGANPSLARKALTTPDGVSYYAVPAPGGICLESSDYLARGCSTIDDAVAGKDVTAVICSPLMAPDRLRVFGVLPDGVSNAHIKLVNGSTVPVALQNNVFVYDEGKHDTLAASVEWDAPDGSHSISAGMPTDAGSEDCQTGVTPAEARQAIEDGNPAAPANAGPKP